MKTIELYKNGEYLATTTRNRTCREAVKRIWECRDVVGGLLVAGRGFIPLNSTDKITANFKKG